VKKLTIAALALFAVATATAPTGLRLPWRSIYALKGYISTVITHDSSWAETTFFARNRTADSTYKIYTKDAWSTGTVRGVNFFKSDTSEADSALITKATGDAILDTANIARDTANTALALANQAYDTARVALDTVRVARDTANAALALAGQAYDTARVALDTVRLVRDTANAALALAGQAYDTARVALDTVRLVRDTANAALARRDTIQTGYGISSAGLEVGLDTVWIDTVTLDSRYTRASLGDSAFTFGTDTDTLHDLYANYGRFVGHVGIGVLYPIEQLEVAENVSVGDTVFADVIIVGDSSRSPASSGPIGAVKVFDYDAATLRDSVTMRNGVLVASRAVDACTLRGNLFVAAPLRQNTTGYSATWLNDGKRLVSDTFVLQMLIRNLQADSAYYTLPAIPANDSHILIAAHVKFDTVLTVLGSRVTIGVGTGRANDGALSGVTAKDVVGAQTALVYSTGVTTKPTHYGTALSAPATRPHSMGSALQLYLNVGSGSAPGDGSVRIVARVILLVRPAKLGGL